MRDFRCFYIDAFPVQSRRKGASTTGIYLSSGSATFEELQRLDAYVPVCYFPKGVDPFACIKVFKPSLKRMQDGFRTLAGPANNQRTVFYHGAFGLFKGDYPSQQELAGCKGTAALYPDRFSHIRDDQLSNLKFDIHLNRKTLDERREVRRQLALLSSKASKNELAKRHGLLERASPFEDPEVFSNVLVQTPPMNEHSECLGMGGKIIKAILEEFTEVGRRSLCAALDAAAALATSLAATSFHIQQQADAGSGGHQTYHAATALRLDADVPSSSHKRHAQVSTLCREIYRDGFEQVAKPRKCQPAECIGRGRRAVAAVCISEDAALGFAGR